MCEDVLADGRYAILIVDDEPFLRDLLAEALSEYRVTVAGDGHTALQLIERNAFRVVITDLMMPEITGFDVLRAARSKSDRVQVLVMTGYPSEDNKRRCRSLGCFDVVSKPFDVFEVRSRVRHCLADDPAGPAGGR
jgi:DNA-binding response OmpR family regulator